MSPISIAGPGNTAPSQWLPRILVVEDDVLIRAAAAQYLRGCGFATLEAVNVDEALDILGADKLVRVVFTDIKLPGSRNGLDLTHAILSDHPNVRVLLTSGISPFPDLPAGVALLKKPYFLYDVERRIHALLAQKENRAAW